MLVSQTHAEAPAVAPAAGMAADPLAHLDRDHFKRGIHWEFIDDPASDVMWVSFSTASRRLGSFNNFRSLQGLPGKKLFVGDPESYYYQKHIHKIIELVKDIRDAKGVRRAIYWGSSMGAYAAVLFGALDLVSSSTYAFAPQPCLTHLNTHAAHNIGGAQVFDPDYKDIRPLLAKRGLLGINALVPCYHAWDGIQVDDFQKLGPNGAAGLQIVGASHRVLEEIAARQKGGIVAQYFRAALRGDRLDIPEAMRPSDLDIQLGILSYYCVEHIAGRAPRPDMSLDDSASKNHGWFNAKMRLYHTEGNYDAAIVAGLRAMELSPETQEHVVCLANTYSSSPRAYGPILAEGLYRQALRQNPKNPVLRAGLANNLRRRGFAAEAAQTEANA